MPHIKGSLWLSFYKSIQYTVFVRKKAFAFLYVKYAPLSWNFWAKKISCCSSDQLIVINWKLKNFNSQKYYDHRPCVAPEQINWTNAVTPIYKTSAQRFIMPVLIWGPMNQVEGLRETIALAIRLNRFVS